LAPQGALVIVCLAAPSRCVRLTANVMQQAALRKVALLASGGQVSIALLFCLRMVVPSLRARRSP
jgi:hypothetical protein